MPTIYLSKLVGSDVVCGCAGLTLTLTFDTVEFASCFEIIILGVPYYATYPDTVSGTFPATLVSPDNWELVEIFAINGTLYSDAGCTVFDASATGLPLTFTIIHSAGTYAVTAVPTTGGGQVFNGSGAIDTPITNTIGSGTITLSFV